MSERPTPSEMADLVHDAVRSSHLDEDARRLAGLLSTQYRERLRESRETVSDVRHRNAAAGEASARGIALARTAADAAVTAAGPTLDGMYSAWWEASKVASRLAGQARRRAEPMLREAAPAAREAGQSAASAARSIAESPAGRAAVVGAAAGAAGAVVMGGALVAAQKLGIMSRIPPHEITTKGARKAARKAAKASRNTASDASRNGDRSAQSRDHPANEAAEAGESAARAPETAFAVPAAVLHVAFGAALGVGFGAAYAQLPDEWRAPLPTLAESMAFATAVWAVSYAGWIPALGLMPPPHRDEPGRPATMVVAHWIFGACLGAGILAGLRSND